MRVNSVFTGFFNKRLVLSSGIAIVMLAVFFTTSSFTDHTDRDLRTKQVNLLIRQIGHRLLLQAGDLTSRVLPVSESKDGLFLLKFEKKLVFNHDSLIVLSQTLLPKTEFPSGYTVTVHDCKKGDIVYGFQLNNTSPDILACTGRSQPEGCYTIEFAFADLYAKAEQKKADNRQLASLSNVNSSPTATGTEELKTAILDDGINQRKGEPGSAKVVSLEGDAKQEESKSKIFAHPIMIAAYGFMLLLGVVFLTRRFGKSSKQELDEHQDQDIINEPVPELPGLGKFLFDAKGQRLLLQSQEISLTDKECKVLELLHKNFGELIPRDTLMQEVWINEGVITGRSLDMFISKLRKKLSADPDLRITNLHGKGYKLETV